MVNEFGESPKQAEYRAWWQPVIDASFDDPEQEPARLFWPNHVRVFLPWPTRVWATAYRYGGDTGFVGVGTNGQEPQYSQLVAALIQQRAEILAELPEGADFLPTENNKLSIRTQRKAKDFKSDNEMRQWLSSALNMYVNALRPRLKALSRELRANE